MAIPEKVPTIGEVLQNVLMKGDISGLSAEERVVYYNSLCESLELNPLTRPFEFLWLNGKLVPYPTRGCTDQLRKRDYVSIKIVSQELKDNLLTVHVHAKSGDGREDEDIGTVAMVYPARYKDRDGNWRDHPRANQALSNEDRANAILKAVTKAKRRVTLSISGLGLPDVDAAEEDELPAVREPKIVPNVLLHEPPSGVDRAPDAPAPDDGNIRPPTVVPSGRGGDKLADAAEQASAAAASPPVDDSGGGAAGSVTITYDMSKATMDEADAYLQAAALDGGSRAERMASLEKAWKELSKEQRQVLEVALRRRHKPTAETGLVPR